MDEVGLRQTIEGPASKAGLRLEPGLAERMLDDVAGEPGAMPLLEFALLQLWGALTAVHWPSRAISKLEAFREHSRNVPKASTAPYSSAEQVVAQRLTRYRRLGAAAWIVAYLGPDGRRGYHGHSLSSSRHGASPN